MKIIVAFLGVLILLAGAAALVHPRVSTMPKKSEVTVDNHKVILNPGDFSLFLPCTAAVRSWPAFS